MKILTILIFLTSLNLYSADFTGVLNAVLPDSAKIPLSIGDKALKWFKTSLDEKGKCKKLVKQLGVKWKKLIVPKKIRRRWFLFYSPQNIALCNYSFSTEYEALKFVHRTLGLRFWRHQKVEIGNR